MLESISTTINKTKTGLPDLALSDRRHLLQKIMRDALNSDEVYCVSIDSLAATVRVGTALLHQEAILSTYDILHQMNELTGTTLKKIHIQQ